MGHLVFLPINFKSYKIKIGEWPLLLMNQIMYMHYHSSDQFTQSLYEYPLSGTSMSVMTTSNLSLSSRCHWISFNFTSLVRFVLHRKFVLRLLRPLKLIIYFLSPFSLYKLSITSLVLLSFVI